MTDTQREQIKDIGMLMATYVTYAEKHGSIPEAYDAIAAVIVNTGIQCGIPITAAGYLVHGAPDEEPENLSTRATALLREFRDVYWEAVGFANVALCREP